MRVFISWSGEPSRLIARALTEWLRPVVQHIEPWMSDEQIRSGTRWREVIGKALDGTDFGIICLTRSNQHEPWLVFEAGALAKRLEVARLVPLFIDLAPSDVTGPLEGWQGQRLDREGVRRLVFDLNEAADKSVPEGVWEACSTPCGRSSRLRSMRRSKERRYLRRRYARRIRCWPRSLTQCGVLNASPR
jgi:hypothetical protein